MGDLNSSKKHKEFRAIICISSLWPVHWYGSFVEVNQAIITRSFRPKFPFKPNRNQFENNENSMTGWQDDRMTRWQEDQKTRRQDDRIVFKTFYIVFKQ